MKKLLFVLILMVPNLLYAQNAFREDMSNSKTFLYYGNDVEADNGLYFNLGLDFMEETLIIKNNNSNKSGSYYKNSYVIPFGLFLRRNRFTIGLNTKQIYAERPQGSYSGLGDLNLSLTYDILKSKKSVTGLGLNYIFDTGSFDDYSSFGKSYPEFSAYHSRKIGKRLTLSGLVVYRNVKGKVSNNYDLREVIKLKYGIDYSLTKKFALGLEGFKEINLGNEKDELNPNNNLALLKYRGKRLNLYGGLGFSNFWAKDDGRDYLLVAGMKWNLFPKKKKEIPVKENVVKKNLVKEVRKTQEMIYFNFDSDVVSKKEREKIVKFAKDPNFKNRLVYLHSNTDAIGSNAYNLELSKKRAESVKKELLKAGFQGEIKMLNHGEDYASKEFADRTQRNVHIIIVE